MRLFFRLFFIVDDTLFFLPTWLDGVLDLLTDQEEVVGITPLATKDKPTLYSYLIKNLPSLGLLSVLKLTIYLVNLKFREILYELRVSNHPISLHQVAHKYKVKVVNSTNVNNPLLLKQVKKLKPDLIISSCSQIFKEEILNLPSRGCINRHSGLLPSYGGVFPIFRAILNKEKQIGITIHYMNKGIDKGKIIYQIGFPITYQDSLFSLYKKAYDKSVTALIKAIKVVKGEEKSKILKTGKASYYSFPTNSDWQKYWKLNQKFI